MALITYLTRIQFDFGALQLLSVVRNVALLSGSVRNPLQIRAVSEQHLCCRDGFLGFDGALLLIARPQANDCERPGHDCHQRLVTSTIAK